MLLDSLYTFFTTTLVGKGMLVLLLLVILGFILKNVFKVILYGIGIMILIYIALQLKGMFLVMML